MMTDQQLEAAAREYCRLAGIDPDGSVGHSAPPDQSGFITMQMLYSPRWRIVAETMAQADLIQHCLQFGKNSIHTA